jgi:membrane-associated phospholipid phosphatase
MVVFSGSVPLPAAWQLVTRLGEAQILLPMLAAVLAWFVARLKAPTVARAWVLCIAMATAITTATKIAFLGYGLGYAPWNFTGLSGHAMFAAAVMPLLAATLASTAPPARRRWALLGGYLLAALIAWSRVRLSAHSGSEALSGWLLGAAASGFALRWAEAPHTHAPKAMVIGAVVWLLVTPMGAPPSPTHGWVTRIALALSGHEAPYTREWMLHRYQQQQLEAAAHPG